jgi:hypothetical protein
MRFLLFNRALGILASGRHRSLALQAHHA